jgi:hypothetical protein
MPRQPQHLTVEVANLALDGLARLQQRSDRSDQLRTKYVVETCIAAGLVGGEGLMRASLSLTNFSRALLAILAAVSHAGSESKVGVGLTPRFLRIAPAGGSSRVVGLKRIRTKGLLLRA